MVTIQPFQYEKTTAFKERVQIANKVNEIISLFNELDIESKINEFNEEIVIINRKIAEIDSKIVEVNNAVNTVEGYNGRLTTVETLSSDNKNRLDNLTPRVTSTENKNVEQDNKINALENESMLIKGLKSFLSPNAGGYIMSGKVPDSITVNNYARLFRIRSFSQQDLTIYATTSNNQLGYIHIILAGSDQYDRSYLINTFGTFLSIPNPFLVRVGVSGFNELWIKKTSAFGFLKLVITHSTTSLEGVEFLGDDTGLSEVPTIGNAHPITGEIITGSTPFNYKIVNVTENNIN